MDLAINAGRTVRKDGAFFVSDTAWRWALLTVDDLLRYFFIVM
jgi:hypothetical protein